ncbi:uncharacterized protein LOC117487223 isoform X2 [Trematomus bernacchii]|uniref:uncharacterized protein LOC117487223 isoform X2 n=1 Tax=Trematomus bernacchii TaxID=40690 RepID=UPI00146DD137|nr:uncharacterized protein LOC117487223 isoform X2 [Trematomus bernacchii]
MGKVLVFSLLVLASLRSASTEEKKPIKEGGSVTLDLRPAPSDPITIIQWKFEDSILAEWVKDVVPLTHNRDNIKLNIVSGRLSMEKMTKADAGVYSVEVNNNVQKVTYNVLVINDVPKPVITFFPLVCSDESHNCTLKCEGDTTGAEPVTYSWKTGDGEWKESRKAKVITKKEHGQVKNFTCKMKNQVSEEVSELFTNKLYNKKEEPKPSPVGWILGGIFFVALLVIVGVVVALKKKIIRCGKDLENGKPDTKNGPAEPLNTPHEDNTVIKDGPVEEAEPLNTPHEDNTVIKDGPAEEAERLNRPHEDKPDIKHAPAEEEADTEL